MAKLVETHINTGLGGLMLAYVIPCLHERLQHRSSSGTAAPCKCWGIRAEGWSGRRAVGAAAGQCPLPMRGPAGRQRHIATDGKAGLPSGVRIQ